MAYNGGTTQIAPRLLSEHHDWLKANSNNVNRTINEALHEYVHRLQFGRIPEDEMSQIKANRYGNGFRYYKHSWENRRKVTVRIERQCLDYLRMNLYVVNRVLDFAIDYYIKTYLEIK